ncbi:hypothetical protein [Akkermansia sp.]|uniref:hypothetical protein n=1 Tax=Akkermansia sp. TaxID=1872421 RepID=UPI0025C59AA6|nr:hypothetical protein [Akkermansia sp.]MCD8271506.1 hypothetical protein [Akkermansia sp.]
MSETVVLNGVFQRLDDMILSKDVIECQRTVFSGKDLVTHGSERLEDEFPFEKKIESNCFKMLIERFLEVPLTESARKKYQENNEDVILMLKSENVHANLTKVTGTFSSL